MNAELALARGKLYLLTFIFCIAEVVFTFQVIAYGNGDVEGSIIKTIALLTFIFLLLKGFNWARWILAIALSFLSVGCFFAWLENEGIAFILIALCYLYFTMELFRSKRLALLVAKRKATDEQAGFSEEFLETTFLEPTSQSLPAAAFQGQQFTYPSLLKRYQALFIDGILLLTVMITIMVITEDSPYHTEIMISTWLIVAFCYEPILSAYSATIGQQVMKIRVRKAEDPRKRIFLWNAYVRFLVKGLLGWLSFLTIHSNPAKRAIHDYAGSSVVVNI